MNEGPEHAQGRQLWNERGGYMVPAKNRMHKTETARNGRKQKKEEKESGKREDGEVYLTPDRRLCRNPCEEYMRFGEDG